VHVSGQVLSSTGAPHWGGVVVLTSATGLATAGGRGAGGLQGSGGRIEGDGWFRVSNVAPGRYRLQVRAGGRDDGEFARMDLTVGGADVDDLTIVTAPAGRLSGIVVTDTGEPLPVGSPGVQVMARPASPDGPFGGAGGAQSRVGADGRFDIPNVIDARLVRVTASGEWTLKAVLLDGEDVTDVPLDVAPGQVVGGLRVVITRRLSHVEGTVIDARKQPVLDATVVIFPVDPARRGFQSRFIRSARPDQQGRFRISAAPPGEYLAVAVQGLEDGQASDPEFLASVEPQATRVTVEEGETKVISLALGR
jgi:hypothetical protein